jgi:signal transduction histidine kinase
VRRVDGDVEFTVSDTGTGIPPELHERIFEEFYQVPGSQPVSGRGTGLGLPYARRLAAVLGGALRVESAEGRGSTFTVRLPAGPS